MEPKTQKLALGPSSEKFSATPNCQENQPLAGKQDEFNRGDWTSRSKLAIQRWFEMKLPLLEAPKRDMIWMEPPDKPHT